MKATDALENADVPQCHVDDRGNCKKSFAPSSTFSVCLCLSFRARERRGVTASDILRAAGTVHEAGEEPNSELVTTVILPVLSAAEQEFRQALSRINLGDLARQVERLNGKCSRESAN
jgi:hypothetical protein